MQGLNLEATCKLFRAIWRLVRTLIGLAATTLQCMMISLRPRRSLAAENLFLRKQLALFQERDIKPRRADDATRAALVWLSRAFKWHEALVVVKPATLIRWHREGCRLYWKFKSRPGRRALPAGWIRHFNAATPHSALGPDIPDPPITVPAKLQLQRHKLPSGSRVNTRPALGGLHHEGALQLAA